MVSTRFQNIVITIALGLFVFGGSVAVGAPTGESTLALREPQAGYDSPSVQLTDAVDDNADNLILPRIVANAQGTLESMEAMRIRKKKSSKKKFDPLEPIGELKNAGGVAAELIPSLFIREESEIDDDSRKPKKKKHHKQVLPATRPKSTAVSKKPAPKKSLLDPVTGLLGGLPLVGGVANKAKGLLGGLPLVGGLL